MSTKYDLRSDPGVEKNYGKLLLEMVSVVPDGIVCFFVSYSYMDGIVNSWHETGLLKVNFFFPNFKSMLFSLNYVLPLFHSVCTSSHIIKALNLFCSFFLSFILYIFWFHS